MTAKVIPMKPKKPASPPKVTPEAGWVERSTYGLLRDLKGNPYVRLEDVHAKVMERDGLTSLQAATRVFSPFVSDAASALGLEHGAEKLRPFLGVADFADRVGGLDAYALKNLSRRVPYVSHPHFAKGTPEALLYALAVMAADVWAPHSGNVDLPDRLGSAYDVDGVVPSAEKAREILGTLAVRHDLAHKLWGWGTVGAAAVDANAASAPPVETPGSGTSGQSATSDATPVAVASYDWSNAKTQAALLAAFSGAPGKSDRAKAAHLATTEKWGMYSAETLRSKASYFRKSSVGKVKSKDVTLANAWVNTQGKSRKAG